MFQRPERASFISTNLPPDQDKDDIIKGFNALNGLLSFLLNRRNRGKESRVFQRPERASFISTWIDGKSVRGINGFNALNGLLSFLQCI